MLHDRYVLQHQNSRADREESAKSAAYRLASLVTRARPRSPQRHAAQVHRVRASFRIWEHRPVFAAVNETPAPKRRGSSTTYTSSWVHGVHRLERCRCWATDRVSIDSCTSFLCPEIESTLLFLLLLTLIYHSEQCSREINCRIFRIYYKFFIIILFFFSLFFSRPVPILYKST